MPEIQGSYSIDIVDPSDGSVAASIDEDDVEAVDVVRVHTAVSDWTADIPFSPASVRDFMTSTFEARLYFRDDLLFRGYLEKAASDQRGNQTTIEGRGIARDLLDFDVEYHAEDVDAHVAISDVWAETNFDATVQDPDSEAVTIDDRDFQGDALTVLQELHDVAGYRFSVDHTDGAKTVESFETGSITRSVDFIVRNRRPATDLYDYANRVVVYGKRDAEIDGFRPKAEAVDEGEIEYLGGDPDDWDPSDPEVKSKIRRRPALETTTEVQTEAETLLEDAVGEREDTGTVVIQPTNVKPGYDYPIDWFDDDDPVPTTNETVEFSEEYQDAQGELEFDRTRGVEEQVVRSRYITQTIGNAI